MKTINPAKIAIADDHAISRKGISSLLNEFGISVVIEAKNGKDLIGSIETAVLVPDICIIEIGMPILDGYETINILNRRWPNIKTLIFTTLYNRHNLIKMLVSGARGYLPKHADTGELLKAIQEISEVGFYQSELEIAYLAKTKNINDLKKEILNDKELLFIKHCCSELTYKEIADTMNISVRTIDNYRDNLFHRLNVKSRVGLVMYALDCGIK